MPPHRDPLLTKTPRKKQLLIDSSASGSAGESDIFSPKAARPSLGNREPNRNQRESMPGSESMVDKQSKNYQSTVCPRGYYGDSGEGHSTSARPHGQNTRSKEPSVIGKKFEDSYNDREKQEGPRARGIQGSRRQDFHDDNERYGGSSHTGGNRARNRSDDGDDEDEDEDEEEDTKFDSVMSRAMPRRGRESTASAKKPAYDSEHDERRNEAKRTAGEHQIKRRKDDKEDEDEEYIKVKRFVALPYERVDPDFVDEACELFKVTDEKFEEWCDDGLVRFDKKNPRSMNLELLYDHLSKKDKERYDKWVREREREREMDEAGIRFSRGAYFDEEDSHIGYYQEVSHRGYSHRGHWIPSDPDSESFD